jgi:hypothetical protein
MINVYQLYSDVRYVELKKEASLLQASPKHSVQVKNYQNTYQHWYIELQDIAWDGHLLDKGFRIDRARI